MELERKIETFTRKYRRIEYSDASFSWKKQVFRNGRSRFQDVLEDEKQLLEIEYKRIKEAK